MNNEYQILPLRKYDVTYKLEIDQNDVIVEETFTADYHTVIDHSRNVFYRTGNIIREYQIPLISIVVTPVDDSEIPE